MGFGRFSLSVPVSSGELTLPGLGLRHLAGSFLLITVQ